MRAGYVRAPWWRRPDGRTLALRYLAAVLVTAFFLFPVYWLFAVSLKTPAEIFATPPVWVPGQFNLSVYYTLFRDGDARTVLNSLIVASTSTVIAMVLGTIGGYSLARYRTGGDNLAVWIISQRMIPPIAIVFPIFLFFALIGWVDTFHGLILLYVAFNLPYVIWMMRGYFQDMPVELEESALIDGCTRWQALWKVTIPVARNGIFATAVFTFIFAWNDYIFALILTRTQVMTYTVQVMGYFGSQSTFWGKISAMSVLGTLPIFLAVATMQRYLVRGISMGAVKA